MVSIREFPPYLSNPLMDGGRVQSISVHPSNADRIIVAKEFGGLWQTSNRGTNWRHFYNLHAVSVKDVAYAPDGNILIATLARDNRVDNGGGIWISRDGGNSWAKIDSSDPHKVILPDGSRLPNLDRIPDRISAFGISYAPDDRNRVYVGTDYGIAVSGDNGSTWSHTMLENTSPISPDRMQNAVFSVLGLSGNRVLALCRTGVYLGVRKRTVWIWNNIRPGQFDYQGGFKNIDISPLDDDKIFILQNYRNSNLLLYEVASRTWTNITLPALSIVNGREYEARGPFVRVSRSSASSSDGSIDIWIGHGRYLVKATAASIDQVKTLTASDWVILAGAAGLHDDTGYLGLNNDKRPILYGSDGGLFKPTNSTATMWTRAATANSGLNSYQITDVAGTNVSSPLGAISTSLYFTTQDNNIWASPDGGMTWSNSDAPEGWTLQVRKDARSEDEVTVAYGRYADYPSNNRFSDANLVRPRDVPVVNDSGARLSAMGKAFFISPRKWIRYREPGDGNTEIYVSENNGETWRKRAYVSLEKRGDFVVSGSASNPVIYAPFKGVSTRAGRAGGGERIGLMKFIRVFDRAVVDYNDAYLIYLPEDVSLGIRGSLGVRATMFDWHAVYAVDPVNPNYIIAPDISTQQVLYSKDGGGSWDVNDRLTKEVTKSSTLLLYDQDEYHMQVTQISFDPYNPDRILVGTRDAGIIISEDKGNTWRTIPDSEVILYITGFFFKRDGTVIVSTYGRGLWKLDFRIDFTPFLFSLYCEPRPCFIRTPLDPKFEPTPVDWSILDVIVFLNGRITGLVLSDGEIKRATVTPGTSFKRYIGKPKEYNDINIVESAEGEGFNGLAGCLAAIQNGEVIKGLILEENKVTGIISGTDEFMETKPVDKAGSQPPEAPSEPEGQPPEAPSEQPYLFITTSLPVSGVPVLGPDRSVFIFARGFKFDPARDNYVTLIIDGQEIDQIAKVTGDGTVKEELKVEQELSYGKHIIKLVQRIDNEETVASSMFIRSAIDDFDENKAEQ